MGNWSCQVRGSLPAPPHLSSGQAGDDEWSTILTTGTTTIIIPRDVGREDGGMYQCIAGNEEEESQAAAQLVLGGQLIMMMMMVMVVRVDLMVLVMVARKRWGDGVKGHKYLGAKNKMVFSNKNNVFKFSRDAKLPNCQFSANIWGSFMIIADSFDNSRTSLTIYNYRVLFPTREDPTFQPPFSSGGGAQSVTDSQKQKTEFQTNFPISPPASTKSQILRGVFSPPTFCR